MNYIEIIAISAKIKGDGLIICGDLNCRMGKVQRFVEYNFIENPDKFIIQYDQQLRKIIKSHDILPLNNVVINDKQFEGRFMFERGEQKSQNDWILCNGFMKKYFSVS